MKKIRIKEKVDLGLLFLRVSTGLMMFGAHGFSKLMNFSALQGRFPDPLGVGTTASAALVVFAEAFCSLALVVGFKTRLVAIPLLITMLVAAGIIHADDPWQKKEFALMYAIPFATLIFTGGGRYTLDYIWGKRS